MGHKPAGRPLMFGYNEGVPEGVTTTWGARAIWETGHHLDIPPDRQGTNGGPRKQELLDYLNGVGMDAWQAEFKTRAYRGEVTGDKWLELSLLDDGVVVVKANPQASYGYLYVCAYFADEASGAVRSMPDSGNP